jgi:hypothetical protein
MLIQYIQSVSYTILANSSFKKRAAINEVASSTIYKTGLPSK